MPFAAKFRAMMGFPLVGEAIGRFVVESVDVRDVNEASGLHAYAARLVLSGPGGEQGVRAAIKALISRHPFTFSAYGTPYQLWCRRPEIERLGDGRYAVSVDGLGARMYLEDELRRFYDYLCAQGLLADPGDDVERDERVTAYLEHYAAEVQRMVDKYRRKVRKEEGAADPRRAKGEGG